MQFSTLFAAAALAAPLMAAPTADGVSGTPGDTFVDSTTNVASAYVPISLKDVLNNLSSAVANGNTNDLLKDIAVLNGGIADGNLDGDNVLNGNKDSGNVLSGNTIS